MSWKAGSSDDSYSPVVLDGFARCWVVRSLRSEPKPAGKTVRLVLPQGRLPGSGYIHRSSPGRSAAIKSARPGTGVTPTFGEVFTGRFAGIPLLGRRAGRRRLLIGWVLG